jgi:hypothetical protein
MKGEQTVNLWKNPEYRSNMCTSMTRLNLDSNLLKEQYELGVSVPELANKYDCSVLSIWTRLKKAGIINFKRGFQNGHVSYDGFLNKSHTNEVKERIRKSQLGDKNNNWKGGVTLEEQNLRMSSKYNDWRNVVFKRDNFNCMECKTRGRKLEAHHIKSFADFPELRFDINNGITLCHNCHIKTKGKEQLVKEKYVNIIEKINKKMEED